MSTQSKLKDPRAKRRAVGQAIVSLFDKTSIYDEAAVDIAIANLDHLLADTSFDTNEVVEAINTVPHLLEFILSGEVTPWSCFAPYLIDVQFLVTTRSTCCPTKL